MDTGEQSPEAGTLRVNKIHATNFRRFRRFEITLDNQLTVLVAPNAVGKTACLDAIAGILEAFTNQLITSPGRHYAQTDIRRALHHERGDEMEVAHDGLSVTADISLSTTANTGPFSVTRSLAHSKRARTTMKDAASLKDYADSLKIAVSEFTDVILPVVAYYGTSRLWRQHRDTAKMGATSRLMGYLNCLEPDSNYKTLDRVLAKWERVVLSHHAKRMAAGESQDVKRFLCPEESYLNCVKQAVRLRLVPTEWVEIGYSFEQETIVAEHEVHGVLPVAELSDGVRAMVTLVADIALRCAQLNPHLGFEANSSPGVVLIDQVDMHLHPTWQQSVLGALLEAFPNIQFIVTTHSPQVLSTVPARNIRLLAPVSAENSDESCGDDSRIMGYLPVESPFAQSAEFALQTIMETHAVPQTGQTLEHVAALKTQLELAVRSGKESDPETQNTFAELDSLGYHVRPADLALWQTLAEYNGQQSSMTAR